MYNDLLWQTSVFRELVTPLDVVSFTLLHSRDDTWFLLWRYDVPKDIKVYFTILILSKTDPIYRDNNHDKYRWRLC